MNEKIDLRHGDCLELIAGLPDKSIDLIVTDPPYHVGMTHNSHKAVFTDLNMLKPFFEQLFGEWRRVLKADGLVYCFTDWRTVPFLQPILDRHLGVKNLLVWDKAGRISPNYGFYHELILFAGHNTRRLTKKNIFTAPSFASNARKTNGEKLHPTQKPVELLTQFILDASDEGDTVLDCFAGSGSTGIACLNSNRRFIGMEIDEKYFRIAAHRLMQHQEVMEKDYG